MKTKDSNLLQNEAMQYEPVLCPVYLYRGTEKVTVIKLGKIWAEVTDEVGNTMHVLRRYLAPLNGAQRFVYG